MRSVNYSSIVDFYTCPKKYELRHIKNEKSSEGASADMAFGTCIHSCVRAILEGDDYEGTFKMLWDLEEKSPLVYSRFQHGELRQIGLDCLAKFKKYHAHKFKPVQMEQRLYGEIDGYKVEGTPDFIGYYEDHLTIVDFKTAAYAYPAEKITCNEQMYMYAMLAKQQFNLDVTQLAYVVFIKQPGGRIQTNIKTLLTPERLESQINNVRCVLKHIEAAGKMCFTQNKNSCIIGNRKCGYWDRCYGDKS